MIKGSPSNAAIEGVLNRLSNDPAFRERMLGDPKAAFAEHGIEIDESKIPTTRSLPSMEEFKRNRAAYQDKLTDQLGYNIFFLR
jgi:putative modified peptide